MCGDKQVHRITYEVVYMYLLYFFCGDYMYVKCGCMSNVDRTLGPRFVHASPKVSSMHFSSVAHTPSRPR